MKIKPANPGTLKEPKLKRLTEFLKHAGVPSACEYCQNEVWVAHNPAMLTPCSDLSGDFALLPVECENCGHIRLFSASRSGCL